MAAGAGAGRGLCFGEGRDQLIYVDLGFLWGGVFARRLLWLSRSSSFVLAGTGSVRGLCFVGRRFGGFASCGGATVFVRVRTAVALGAPGRAAVGWRWLGELAHEFGSHRLTQGYLEWQCFCLVVKRNDDDDDDIYIYEAVRARTIRVNFS